MKREVRGERREKREEEREAKREKRGKERDMIGYLFLRSPFALLIPCREDSHFRERLRERGKERREER